MRTTAAILMVAVSSISIMPSIGVMSQTYELIDHQTDPAFVQSCLPLVKKQWQFHEAHEKYQSTEVIIAETNPDFYTEIGGVRTTDYCVTVAFIYKNGTTYDFTSLRCSIEPNGKTSIDHEGCGPNGKTEGGIVYEQLKSLARNKLPTKILDAWVDPYRDLETRQKRIQEKIDSLRGRVN